MEILRDIYLDTDRILQGVEYSLVYRGPIFNSNSSLKKDDKTIIRYNNIEVPMVKTDYGYKANITFLEPENEIKILREGSFEEYKIYTEEASKKATEYIYGNNELKLMPRKVQIIPDQIITAISKTMKIIPKIIGKTLNIKDLFESRQ